MRLVDLEVDSFTPCLVDRITGEIIDTDYCIVAPSELGGFKKQGWLFDWTDKSLKDSSIYKLCLRADAMAQGLVALEFNDADRAVHIILAESAPHNKGHSKRYDGVGGHLFAIAAKVSLEVGYGGFIYFEAKNMNLVRHYQEKFGAVYIGIPHPYSMIIDEYAAQRLLNSYTID